MAEYYKGKTIDLDDNFIKIEGERYPYIKEHGEYYYDYAHADGKKDFCKGLHGITLNNLGIEIIKNHPTKCLFAKKRRKHIKELARGVQSWNEWRVNHPHIRPILYELNFDKIKEKNQGIKSNGLQGINFSNANLIQSNLVGVDLTKANFHEANLGEAKLMKATLVEANFCRTDFYKTKLWGANLSGANLQGSQIAGTEFTKDQDQKTQIKNCKVYGSSAWDIKDLDQADQKELKIVYKMSENEELTTLSVDDLSMAQFLFFILNNKNLTNVFKSTHSSIVLILGRFRDDRKEFLNNIRDKLANKKINGTKYIPIIFDFEKSENQDFTQVITVLAGMSRFIIADLTDPSSIAQELHAFVGEFQIPVIPIIESSEKSKTKPFSLFVDYYKYGWVHSIIEYSSKENFYCHFDKLICEAEAFYTQTNNRKKNVYSISIDKL
ncbi:pentapeptide repeat-containing protein [Flavitalea sp.]|nr:pentapeptide repeat-containing protein [Flavitalea sp.]